MRPLFDERVAVDRSAEMLRDFVTAGRRVLLAAPPAAAREEGWIFGAPA